MNIQEIQTKILNRYEQEGRKFPWRETTDPYKIHLCEVMSQQTQLSRVLVYRTKWLERFPDYEAVANASQKEILTYRSGLWFNRRWLNFRNCAKAVCTQYHGKLPLEREKLLHLPGIWAYTAAAICAFADNQEIPVIDTNIRRVLIFLFSFPETLSLQQLEKEAKSLIPSWRSRDRHNALMDYGALILTPQKTKIKSLSKQSKFENSDRQVRGRIIKTLVKKGELSLTEIKEEFPLKDIDEIIQGLVKEKMVICTWNRVVLGE